MNNDPYNPQQPQNSPNPQVLQPQQQAQYADSTRQQAPEIYTGQPVQSDSNNQSPLKNKKVLIISSVAGAVVLLILAVVLVASSGSKTQKTTTNDTGTANKESILSPARAIDIEQVSNSISQDMSNMNDDSQLPATRIDDKTLGL